MINYFSDISLWWLLPAGILAAGLSYMYYFRSVKSGDWTAQQRRLLSILRAAGLLLLFLLLFGLLWESIRYRDEKPLFITMVDNSSSMLNYSDSSLVRQRTERFRTQLEERFGDQFELMTLEVGERTRPYAKADFSDKQTDLSQGFEHVRELFFNRNIGGIVLISDGNFNRGTHPMYSAGRIELTPVFALGAGDTITRRDQLIKGVNTNEVAFLNNTFPIETTVDFNRMPKGPVTVSLLHNGKTIDKQTVQCTNAVFDQQQVIFTVTASTKGFQRYTVVVERKTGEYTFDNNQASCYIEVLDNKNLICLVSAAPHPDLAAIRSILEEDAQTEIVTSLTKNFTLPKQRPNLVVWYENGSNPNPELFRSLNVQKIPVLLILGPTTGTSVIRSYDLGLTPPGSNQQDDVQGSLSSGFSAFTYTTSFTDALHYYPPLRTRFGTFRLPPNAEVLLTQRIGNIVKKDPLLFVARRNDVKNGVLLGEGLWRWKIREFAQRKSIDGFREFIQKLVQYLVVQQNREPLRVTLPKRFNVTEDVQVKAEFYNEAMELIITPEIRLQLTGPDGKVNTLDFSPLSNFYRANPGQLSPGTYHWAVTAAHNGKKYQKSGEFLVEDLSIEQTDTRSDFSVLNQLARQSGGSFHRLKDADRLLNEIAKRGDITTLQYADSGYVALIDWKWIFVFAVLIFGTEWFLRRWWGAY